jgi:microcystin-dependent protein
MGDQAYIGEVSIFAGTYAPHNWAFCDGQLLAIANYQALYAIVGTYYGGDGRSTLGLPDLRGRSVVGAGLGPGRTPRQIGEFGGNEGEPLTTANLATHTHPAETTVAGTMSGKLKCVTENGTAPVPSGAYIAAHENAFLRNGTVADMNPGAVEVDTSALSATTTVQNAGNGQPHENMHPWQAINYIICFNGIFPPRS